MKKWLKRIRGVLGTGLTWALVWGVVGTAIRIVALAISDDPFGGVEPVTSVLALLGTFGAMGFIGGVAFGTVLGITEGRRRFDQMSLPRFAAWGGAGGLVLSVIMFIAGGFQIGLGELVILGTLPLLGAGSAAGSLALARGLSPLLEVGESGGLIEGEYPAADSAPAEGAADIDADIDDIGLTEEEKRELLA